MKILGGILGVLVLAAGGFYAFMGGFQSVDVTEATFPEMKMFYTTHLGPYENLSESWAEFGEKMESLGMSDCDAVSVYLDEPSTPPEKLRSIIGCKMANLDDDVKQKVMSTFKTFTLPTASSFTASFPYRNILSFWMAPSKIYPKMQNLIATNVIEPSVAIETYGFTKGRDKINIFMPAKMKVTDYQPLFDAFEGGAQ